MDSQAKTTTARQGPTGQPPRVQVGELTVTLLDGGHLWLDGGAMFGIIPKPMWSKLTESDERNRIPLAMTCLLLQSGGKRVLIETGAGVASKYSEKEQGFFRFASHWILDSLQAAGVDRESIDYVIPTHLHFDHAGGGTMPDGRGGYMPTFPRARYIVQRGEWEDAVGGHAVMSATYRPENLGPLEAAGVLSLIDGEAEIVPGVRVVPMPGHTRHLQGVVIDGGSAKAVQPGDLLPTSAHVGIRFNMAYDLLPYENMRNKERLLNDALRGEWQLLLGQDPREAIWRVESESRGGFVLAAGGEGKG
jgi:glyoxylase-like metal-dependent hydrolase (beta-lactamase superfamily II)